MYSPSTCHHAPGHDESKVKESNQRNRRKFLKEQPWAASWVNWTLFSPSFPHCGRNELSNNMNLNFVRHEVFHSSTKEREATSLQRDDAEIKTIASFELELSLTWTMEYGRSWSTIFASIKEGTYPTWPYMATSHFNNRYVGRIILKTSPQSSKFLTIDNILPSLQVSIFGCFFILAFGC